MNVPLPDFKTKGTRTPPRNAQIIFHLLGLSASGVQTNTENLKAALTFIRISDRWANLKPLLTQVKKRVKRHYGTHLTPTEIVPILRQDTNIMRLLLFALEDLMKRRPAGTEELINLLTEAGTDANTLVTQFVNTNADVLSLSFQEEKKADEIREEVRQQELEQTEVTPPVSPAVAPASPPASPPAPAPATPPPLPPMFTEEELAGAARDSLSEEDLLSEQEALERRIDIEEDDPLDRVTQSEAVNDDRAAGIFDRIIAVPSQIALRALPYVAVVGAGIATRAQRNRFKRYGISDAVLTALVGAAGLGQSVVNRLLGPAAKPDPEPEADPETESDPDLEAGEIGDPEDIPLGGPPAAAPAHAGGAPVPPANRGPPDLTDAQIVSGAFTAATTIAGAAAGAEGIGSIPPERTADSEDPSSDATTKASPSTAAASAERGAAFFSIPVPTPENIFDRYTATRSWLRPSYGVPDKKDLERQENPLQEALTEQYVKTFDDFHRDQPYDPSNPLMQWWRDQFNFFMRASKFTAPKVGEKFEPISVPLEASEVRPIRQFEYEGIPKIRGCTSVRPDLKTITKYSASSDPDSYVNQHFDDVDVPLGTGLMNYGKKIKSFYEERRARPF